jgi:DNA polymerase III subunit gamma/tau
MTPTISQSSNILTDYRPRFFREIIGQQKIVSQLCHMIAKNNMPSAVMFSGKMGSGKTTLARVLTRAMSCENWTMGQSEPCGECHSCQCLTNVPAGANVHYYAAGASISDERLQNVMRTVIQGLSSWVGGRMAILLIDDLENAVSKKQQMRLRASLDERWPRGMLISTTMDSSKIDAPLRQRLMECPVTPANPEELEKWAREIAVNKEGLKLVEKKAIAELVRSGGSNFRAILGIIQTLRSDMTPLTIENVRLAALQNGISAT